GTEDFSFCRVSGEGQPSAAIFGDSHADHLFPGIAKFDQQRTWLLIGHTGCAPLSGVRSHLNRATEACLERNNRILTILAANQAISTVVLSCNGPYYISEGASFTPGYTDVWSPKNWLLEPAGSSPTPRSKKSVFASGLDRAISILEQAGKRVILYTDVPGLPFLPADCSRRRT